jgi:hypothetical protein
MDIPKTLIADLEVTESHKMHINAFIHDFSKTKEEDRNTLCLIFIMMNKLRSFENYNKMGLKNTSLMFAPNIIRPRYP